MKPAYGPPYATGMPKLCASPTTISAPHDAGVASAAIEIASATTAIGTVSEARTASCDGASRASTQPKKFGDCSATAA